MDLKTLKYFKIFYKDAAKKASDGRLLMVCEIGDAEGSGRPGNMNDTHSLKWHRAGFGPAAFNAISASFFWSLFGNAADINTSPSDRPIGCAE